MKIPIESHSTIINNGGKLWKIPGFNINVEKIIDEISKISSQMINNDLLRLNEKLFKEVVNEIINNLWDDYLSYDKFNFIFDNDIDNEEKNITNEKILISSEIQRNLSSAISIFLIWLNWIYEDCLTDDDDDNFDFINSFNYINSKFPINKKININWKKILNALNKKFISEPEKKILSFFKDFIKLINNFNYFLYSNSSDSLKIDNINFYKDSKIIELHSFLLKLNDLSKYTKENTPKFANYLDDLMKFVNLFTNIRQYLQFTSYDSVINKIINIKKEEKLDEISNKIFSGLKMNKNFTNLNELLILMTYLYKKFDEINCINVESDLFTKFTWIEVFPKTLNKFGKSKLKKELENISPYNKRLKITKIVLKKEKIFLKNWKKTENELFEYIKWIIDDKKLDWISNFFSTNHIDFSEKELIFIFVNELEDLFFVKKKWNIKKIILWVNNKVKIWDIKNLIENDFLYLKTLDDIWEIKKIINKLLEDTNACSHYSDFIKNKEKLKNVFTYLHKSFLDDILDNTDIMNLEFDNIDNISNYIKNLDDICEKNSIYETSKRNKKLLSWDNKNLEDLDFYYILFDKLSNEYLNNLLEKIFSLNVVNFQYIKNFLTIFKWNEASYKRLLKQWCIKNILINKNSIDWFVKDTKEYNISYILNKINNIPKLDNSFNLIKNKIKWIYWKINWKRIINIKLKTNLLKYIISIWRLLNYNQLDFINWLEKNTKLNKWNFENIFKLFSFFKKYNIYTFKNIWKIFDEIILLKKWSKEIKFLNKSFENMWEIKDTNKLIEIIIKYFKEKDKSIIKNYLIKLNKTKVSAHKTEDQYIKNIVEKWSKQEKEILGQQLNVFIKKIVEWFNPRKVTSTSHKDAWKWTWWAAKVFKKIYLRNLLKKEHESFINYINRIYIINWKIFIKMENSDLVKNKKLNKAYNSSEDINYLFFEAFEKFSDFLFDYEQLQTNISISKLIKDFKDLYEDWINNFKKSNKI